MRVKCLHLFVGVSSCTKLLLSSSGVFRAAVRAVVIYQSAAQGSCDPLCLGMALLCMKVEGKCAEVPQSTTTRYVKAIES